MNLLAMMYTAFYMRHGAAISDLMLGRGTSALLEEMAYLEGLVDSDRKSFVAAKLEAAMAAAGDTAFYLNKIPPDVEEPLARLQRIPVLLKEQIRNNPDSFLRSSGSNPVRLSTAGSTGEPLSAYSDPNLSSMTLASMTYGRRWWGIHRGAPSLHVWGHSKYLGDGFRNRFRLALRRIRDRLQNRIVVPAYSLSEFQLDSALEIILRFKPQYISGYASAVWKLAVHNFDNGSGVRTPFVVTTGEKLYDYQKEDIERSFGCSVIQEYGLAEVGVVAYTCPSGRFHVMDSNVYVELLDDSDHPVAPGEVGRVVVTPLNCLTVPYLRYDTGDLATAVAGECQCGRLSPSFANLEGRAYDVLVDGEGNNIPGVTFTHALKFSSLIKQYQIVQRRPGCIEISYVSDVEVDDQEKNRILELIANETRSHLAVTWMRKDHLQREGSGKFRLIRRED